LLIRKLALHKKGVPEMMTMNKILFVSTLIVTAIFGINAHVATAHAASGSGGEQVSVKDIRQEMSEVFKALGKYTSQERDEALREANMALNKFDHEIDKLENKVRENWHDMAQPAREKASAVLSDIKKKRNALSERYGELKNGADDAWADLMKGFSNAWEELTVSLEEGNGTSKSSSN
jgi:peptidoglycan hydrolase CwlO-like protein